MKPVKSLLIQAENELGDVSEMLQGTQPSTIPQPIVMLVFLFYVKELENNYIVRFSRSSLDDQMIRIFQPVLTAAAE